MDKEKILGFDVAKYLKVYLFGNPEIKEYDPKRSEEVKQSGKQFLTDVQSTENHIITNDFKFNKIYKAIFDLNKRMQNLSIPIKGFEFSAAINIMNGYEEILKIKKESIQNQLDAYPLHRKLLLEDAMNELFENDLITVNDLINDMMKGEYLKKVDEIIYSTGLISFAQYLDEEIKKEDKTIIPEFEKLKWTGKAAHLGYFMRLFAELGYIDAPRGKDGEISNNEFARQLSKVFDFEGNNIGTLSKMVSLTGNNIETHNRDKIQIPHIKDICGKDAVNK